MRLHGVVVHKGVKNPDFLPGFFTRESAWRFQ
jgi:hypothetical protein